MSLLARVIHQDQRTGVVEIDCSDRQNFSKRRDGAWQLLRKGSIGGYMEDLRWKVYQQAKDIHPSTSFDNIFESFLARGNMGLDNVKCRSISLRLNLASRFTSRMLWATKFTTPGLLLRSRSPFLRGRSNGHSRQESGDARVY